MSNSSVSALSSASDGAAALASERHLTEGLALFRDIGYSEDEEVRNGLLMLYNLITKHVKLCQNCIYMAVSKDAYGLV